METDIFKQLPYGTSDFRSIRTGNYAYINKTRFIKSLQCNKKRFDSHYHLQHKRQYN
jgi:hypothetical protein